jgi:hypothetical protein
LGRQRFEEETMKRLLTLIFALLGPVAMSLAASDYLYHTAAGSRLVLNQPIEIPAHTATVYFQGGRVVSPADLDEYYPHCLLLSRVVAEQSQAVPPGEFVVRRAFPYEEEHSRAGSEPVHLAGLGIGIGVGGTAGGGARTSYYFTTRFELTSTSFPDAMYFECRHISDYAIGEHIREDEFSQVVGGLWNLRPPA